MGSSEPQQGSDWSGGLASGLSGLFSGGLADLVGNTRQQLAATSVTGTAGGGAVSVTMTGEGRLTAVSISPEVFNESNASALEELIVAAASDAFEKAAQAKSGALGGVLSGLGLNQ